MWEPYLKLIRENCSEGLHILDRFHVVANMNKALDKVRAEETGRLKREGRDVMLRKSRWLLLRRSDKPRCRTAFPAPRSPAVQPENGPRLSPQGSLAATLGLQLAGLGRRVSRRVVPPNHAIRIEPFKEIARSLRQHRELILNYFRAQKLISSGVVEGLNNKAKVTMRKSYGFRTCRVLELALYHSLGKLPESKLTHDFL
jgi:transposase